MDRGPAIIDALSSLAWLLLLPAAGLAYLASRLCSLQSDTLGWPNSARAWPAFGRAFAAIAWLLLTIAGCIAFLLGRSGD